MVPAPAARAQRGAATDRYQPALDGLRAVAVTAVVLFHAGIAWLPGGFLGVDVFFVLSGFLITSLLLAEHARTGRVRLAAFWGRRARRLLPAVLVMLATVAVAGRYLLPPLDFRMLRGDELAALGYVANWRMIYRGADYFAQMSAASPVQHTWSLGIEEQFYLLWPLLVVALLGVGRLLRPRHAGAGGWPWRPLLVVVCGATVASVVAGALLFRPANPNRAYFGTDTRAQALLVGCLLAIVVACGPAPARHRRHRVLGVLALLGAAVLGWLFWQADGSSVWLYRGGLTGCALAVAAILAHATTSPRSLTARVLALPPLVWLGRISYGVYLWHWPLFQFVNAQRTGLGGAGLLGLRLVAVLAVALASYVLVEQPIRRGRWLRVPRPLVPAGAAVLATTLTGVAVLVATQPLRPQTLPVAVAQPPVPPAATAAGTPSYPPPMQRQGRRPGAQPRVDIFGDSVAWTIGSYLPAHPGLTVTPRAIEGCGITLQADVRQLGTPHSLYSYCPTWPSRYQSAVNADDPDVSVLLLNRWELMDARYDGSYQHVGEAAFDSYLRQQLDQAIQLISARGARVVLLTAAYTHRAERPDGGLYDEDQPARVDAWNMLLRQEVAAHPAQVLLLDLNAMVCPGGRYTDSVGGLLVRSDGLHFTPEGVQRLIAPWLLPQLSTLAITGKP